MNINVIVLSASRYDIKGENGEHVKGVSCSYLLTDSLAPRVDPSGDALGLIAAKCSFPYEAFSKFKACPGIYSFDCDFNVSGGVGGKAAIRPIDFEFVSDLTAVKK